MKHISYRICEEDTMTQDVQYSENELSKEEEKILNTIETWMDHNIKTMISGKCNVACATILGIYMEILGGISDGTLSEIDESGKFFRERHNFQKFLELMQKEYRSLNCEISRNVNKRGLYGVYRSNLVHSYFFGHLEIKNDPEHPDSRCCENKIGIQESKTDIDKYEIHTNDLAADIRIARENLFRMIRKGDGNYRNNFRKAIENVKKIQNLQKEKKPIKNITAISGEVKTSIHIPDLELITGSTDWIKRKKDE
jgi:hypothetical protein